MIDKLVQVFRSWVTRKVLRVLSWLIAVVTRESRSKPKGMFVIHEAVFEHHEYLARRRLEMQRHNLCHTLKGKRLHYCHVGPPEGVPNWLLPYGPSLKISLFEPDHSKCERLNAQFNDAVVHRHSYGVGNPEDNTLHITKNPGLSSLLKPFGSGWSLLQGDDLNAVRVELELQGTQTIRVKPLKNLVSQITSHIDVLKIDVQGYEHEVLSGLGEHRPMLIQCAVSSVETYQRQKTMGAIFKHLEDLGYFVAKFMPSKNHCHIFGDARRNSYKFHGDCILIPQYSAEGAKIIDRWPEAWRFAMEMWDLRNVGQSIRHEAFTDLLD